MGTINSAFSIATGALDADQSALSIVANNVANANTPGYTEEVPIWQENQPIQIGGTSNGDGVTETGALSLRDSVLLARLDQQQQAAAASGARSTALNQVQALFTPDSGSTSSTAGDIGSDITTFFNSFSSLEADPSNNSLREEVLSSAQTLAGDISNAAASLNEQGAALNQEATGVTSQINSLTGAIAQLNDQIQTSPPSAAGGTGSDGTLVDQRNEDISQLSQLIGVNQVTTENNGLSLTTASGQALVSGTSSFPLSSGMVSGATHFFLGSTDITADLAAGGGQLGGNLTASTVDIPGALHSLDQLAYGVSTSVNALNNTGTDLNGVTGTAAAPLYIFNQPTQVAGSALAMTVTMTDPNQIAAAALGQGAGTSANATAMANLASQTIVGSATPINYFSDFVSTLGATVSGVQAENTAQNASVTQLQTQNNALSAVNLNDEAAAMSTLQNSYQAAAQVFNLLNTVMTSALNLGEETTVT